MNLRVILFGYLASQGTGIINAGQADISDIHTHAQDALEKANSREDKRAPKNGTDTRVVLLLIENDTAYFAVVNPVHHVPVNIDWELIEEGSPEPSIEKAMDNMMIIVRSFRQR